MPPSAGSPGKLLVPAETKELGSVYQMNRLAKHGSAETPSLPTWLFIQIRGLLMRLE